MSTILFGILRKVFLYFFSGLNFQYDVKREKKLSVNCSKEGLFLLFFLIIKYTLLIRLQTWRWIKKKVQWKEGWGYSRGGKNVLQT